MSERRTRRFATAFVALVAFVAFVVPAGVAGAHTAAPKLPPPSAFVARVDNPYFPLTPGTTLVYKGSSDGRHARDQFSVLGRTTVIAGVRCTVVHDRLFLDGRLAEDTYDWYAQDRHGTVWYFGEATSELDERGDVVSTEGSWKAGVDGARPGIFMPATPHVGARYQQEFAAGQAEDRFAITSLHARVRVPYGTFRHALRTKEWTPLEPGVVSEKYYVRGIGTVREADVRGGDEQLDLVRVHAPTR